jgi:hypothetical protein
LAKIEILRFVAENEPCTALDLSDYRDRSASCCSTQLGRFYRWGLLDRYKIQGKEFCYTITPKGLERLEYLEDIYLVNEENDFNSNYAI